MFLAGMFVVRRKHLVEIGGYDEEITYGENTELSWRLKPQINQKAFIDTPFLEICQSSLRPSASPANLHHSINRILERHEAFFEVNPAIKFLYLNNLGVACMRLSLPREARTRFRQALAIRPFDFKTLIRIFVTLSPVWFQRLTYRRHQHRASENQRKPSEV
jgi:hypothetical protein